MKKLLLLTVIIVCSMSAFAQRVSVSTDLLKLGTLSPNISVETNLSSRLTLNLEASMNPFGEVYKEFSTNHVAASTELRWWFQRTMYAHFVGVNFMGSMYDIRIKDFKSKGKMLAAGLTYGYSIILSHRWSLTPTIGYGYGIFSIDGIRCYKPTITKLGMGLTYIID